jgi:hypothetical protein
MRSTHRSRLLALAATATLSFGAAAPAQAAPSQQGGLVNVNVSDIVVQLPLSVAANVCDLTVNALAAQLETGDTDCDAVARSQA